MSPIDATLKEGRFVVLEALGEGSQGRTFAGFDRLEGRPVAIKRFDVRGATAWKDVELAEREARVLKSLRHANLPRYVDHFEEGGALYLVMEKIEGESLAARTAAGRPLSEREVVRMLGDLGDLLDYLHGCSPPVIHRDIKPANVLLRPDGSFALVDFGAVRDKLKPQGGSTVVGTFGFMAPEQFQGRALPASDVYAAGATALSLLTGRPPEDLPHQGLSIDVRAALGGRSSSGLVRVLEAMLVPDPDGRATRIGPLLGSAPGRPPSRSSKDDPHGVRRARQAERQAWREGRRQQRRAERRARRGRGGRMPFAGPLAIMFAIAMLGVSIATQAVVPIVLTILSFFFARAAMRRAAASVQVAGRDAIDRIDEARASIRSSHEGGRAPGARLASEPPAGRVADDEDDDEEADEYDRRDGKRRL